MQLSRIQGAKLRLLRDAHRLGSRPMRASSRLLDLHFADELPEAFGDIEHVLEEERPGARIRSC